MESIDRQHSIVLSQPDPVDVWASEDGIMRLNLRALDVSGVSSAGIVLYYDTNHLNFLDVQPGTFLGNSTANEPSQVFVKHVDEELGRIKLMFPKEKSEP